MLLEREFRVDLVDASRGGGVAGESPWRAQGGVAASCAAAMAVRRRDALWWGPGGRLANAQDEALALLLRERGLLSPEVLERAWHQARSGGPLAQVLAAERLLAPAQVADLLRHLIHARFVCSKCGSGLGYDGLASLPSLACPACGAPLRLLGGAAPTSSGALPAVSPGSGSVYPAAPATGIHSAAGRSGAHPAAAWDLEETVLNQGRDRARRAVEETVRGHVAEAPPPPQPPPGAPTRTIGPYVLHEELGRGSNGVVFLATRAGLARRFAVKVLLANHLADAEGIERFRREAQIASKLDDPGIVAVFDIGREEDRYYYAMEYCPGETLHDRLRREQRLAPREAARLVQRLARVVAVAHGQGVLHRDIKPANVILAEGSGEPRITDFGLARDRSLGGSLTRTGDILGTPYYMAPEQLRGEKDLDQRVDVYALGVVLYECLTGTRPFAAPSPVELGQQILYAQPEPVRARAPDVPEALEAICARAMAKDPAARPHTAAALADELGVYVSEADKPQRARRGGARRRQAPVVAIAAGGLALFAGAFAGGLLLLRSSERAGWQEGVEAALADLDRAAAEAGPPVERMRAEAARARRGLGAFGATPPRELEAAVAAAEARVAAWDALLAAEGAHAQGAVGAADLDGARARVASVHPADAALSARLARLVGSAEGQRAWRAARDAARAVEPYVAAVEEAFRRAAELAAPDPALRLAIEADRLEYLRRRGRSRQALAGTVEGADGAAGREVRLVRARALGLVGAVDEAQALLRALAEEQPEDRVGRVATAILRWLAKDAAGTLSSARLAREQDPERADARAYEAKALLALERPSEAQRALEALLAAEPDCSDAYRELATLCLTERRVREGLEALRTLRTLQGELDPTTLLVEVQLQLAADDHAAAAARLEQLIAADPSNYEARFLLGFVHHSRNDVRRAVEVWRALDREAPDEFTELVRGLRPERLQEIVFEVVRGRGRWGDDDDAPLPLGTLPEAARQRLEARAQAAAEPARASLREALLLAGRGARWFDIEPTLRAAHQAAPRDRVVALERARILLGRDRYAEAREAIAAARAIAPARELDRLEAELFYRSGRRAEAARGYEALAAADPDGVEGLVARGESHRQRRRMREALTAARAARERDPDHLGAAILLAFVQVQEGRAEEALEVCRGAYELHGAVDSRLVLAHVLAAQRYAVERLGRERGSMRRGMRVLQAAEQLFALSDAAYHRLAVVQLPLQLQLPGDVTPLWLWIRQRLGEARRIEPDRAEIDLFEGVLEIRMGAPRERVDALWARARELDPELELGSWPEYYRRAFGTTPELEALLERER